MTWDAEGNRVSYTSSTNTANPYTYVYDPLTGIPAVIEEAHAGSAVQYVRSPGGTLLARVNGNQTQYYAFDDLGSTMFLTGNTGTVTDKYVYDAWGNVTNHEGTTNQPYQYVGALGYYTHYQDANQPLLQTGVRFYNPGTGRFTSKDPIEDGVNYYSYVDNNPVALVDPNGLSVYTIGLSGVFGLIPGGVWNSAVFAIGHKNGAPLDDGWSYGIAGSLGGGFFGIFSGGISIPVTSYPKANDVNDLSGNGWNKNWDIPYIGGGKSNSFGGYNDFWTGGNNPGKTLNFNLPMKVPIPVDFYGGANVTGVYKFPWSTKLPLLGKLHWPTWPWDRAKQNPCK